jgi:hypothetical protein
MSTILKEANDIFLKREKGLNFSDKLSILSWWFFSLMNVIKPFLKRQNIIDFSPLKVTSFVFKGNAKEYFKLPSFFPHERGYAVMCTKWQSHILYSTIDIL